MRQKTRSLFVIVGKIMVVKLTIGFRIRDIGLGSTIIQLVQSILARDDVFANRIPYFVSRDDGETIVQAAAHPISKPGVCFSDVQDDTLARQLVRQFKQLDNSNAVAPGSFWDEDDEPLRRGVERALERIQRIFEIKRVNVMADVGEELFGK